MKAQAYEVLLDIKRIVPVDADATIHVMDDTGVAIYPMPVFTRKDGRLYVAPGQYKTETNGLPSIDPNMEIEVLYDAATINVASDAAL